MLNTKPRAALILTALLLAAVTAASSAFACDEATRQQFLDDVAAGIAPDELEAIYGPCRNAGQQPTSQKLISIISTGNTFFEDLNGCGYNPQSKEVACDVEVKQFGGYGGFPTGSQEYVRFCFACGTTSLTPPFFNAEFLGTVHVTNDIGSGGTPPFFFEASSRTWSAPPPCTAADGLAFTVRAILSWAVPPANCFAAPVWGNQITFNARRDP